MIVTPREVLFSSLEFCSSRLTVPLGFLLGWLGLQGVEPLEDAPNSFLLMVLVWCVFCEGDAPEEYRLVRLRVSAYDRLPFLPAGEVGRERLFICEK